MKLTFCANLEKVVDDDGLPEVEGLSPGHKLRARKLDAVEVEAARGDGGQGGVHQGPVVHAAIAEVPASARGLIGMKGGSAVNGKHQPSHHICSKKLIWVDPPPTGFGAAAAAGEAAIVLSAADMAAGQQPFLKQTIHN